MQKLDVMVEYISFNLLRIQRRSMYKTAHVSALLRSFVQFRAVRTFRNVTKYLESEENMKQSLLACIIRRLNFVSNFFKTPKILFICQNENKLEKRGSLRAAVGLYRNVEIARQF